MASMNYGASYLEGFQLYNGSPLTANADGSYTLSGLNPNNDFTYANNGYPSSHNSDQDLGLPGNPAFQPGDITGYNIATIGTAYTSENIVQLTQLDQNGALVTSSPIGTLVAAQGPEGYLIEVISGFFPTNFTTGSYVGTLSGQFFFLSYTNLDTLDGNNNPLTPVNAFPTTFEPNPNVAALFTTAGQGPGASAVPAPGMGLVFGLLAVGFVAVRLLRGRAGSAAVA